jgi:hypothetical protein
MEAHVAAPVSRKALWAGWIVSVVPVLMLAMSAIMKFVKPPFVMDQFAKFGYDESVLVQLGIVEIGCALIYLFPRTAVLGAILVTGYLGGATATHVRISDPPYVTPIVLGVMVWLGLYLREPRLRVLAPLRS